MHVYILVVPQNITVKVASIMLGKSSKMYTLNTMLNFPEIKMYIVKAYVIKLYTFIHYNTFYNCHIYNILFISL